MDIMKDCGLRYTFASILAVVGATVVVDEVKKRRGTRNARGFSQQQDIELGLDDDDGYR